MSSPVKKKIKRSRKQSPESSTNTALPYDLIVSILARVPRVYYTKLSLVSKNFRSLLASPELYQTRKLFGCTETFLHVCLRFPSEGNTRWFTLYRSPNRETQKNPLAPTSTQNSPTRMVGSNFIAVGYNFYAVPGKTIENTTSTVWFLDCRTNTWHEAPRMKLRHTDTSLDGEMYLAGISKTPDSLHCVEVYNTMTHTWNPVLPRKWIWQSRNMEGKIYVQNPGHGLALTPKNQAWELVGWELDEYRYSIFVIGDITIHYDPVIRFLWRKTTSNGGSVWRTIRGLEEIPKFARYSIVRLADYGGKLVVFWDKYVPASGYKEKRIWCAEISLEIRNNEYVEEIWGKVEWFDVILSVPKSYIFVGALVR